MADDVGGWYVIVMTQGFHEIGQRLELVGGGEGFAKIADQSHADALLVHSCGITVSSALLLDPAGGGLDLAITLSQTAVVNEEVVAQAIPESPVGVRAVDQIGLADIGGGMVDHDVFPARIRIEGNDVSKRLGIGNDQPLAGMDGVAGLQ